MYTYTLNFISIWQREFYCQKVPIFHLYIYIYIYVCICIYVDMWPHRPRVRTHIHARGRGVGSLNTLHSNVTKGTTSRLDTPSGPQGPRADIHTYIYIYIYIYHTYKYIRRRALRAHVYNLRH